MEHKAMESCSDVSPEKLFRNAVWQISRLRMPPKRMPQDTHVSPEKRLTHPDALQSHGVVVMVRPAICFL